MKSIFSLFLMMILSLAVCQAQEINNEKPNESELAEKIMVALDVSEEQAVEILAIMKESAPKNKKSKKPNKAEIEACKAETDCKVKAILTDAQYEKYQEFQHLKDSQNQNSSKRKQKR